MTLEVNTGLGPCWCFVYSVTRYLGSVIMVKGTIYVGSVLSAVKILLRMLRLPAQVSEIGQTVIIHQFVSVCILEHRLKPQVWPRLIDCGRCARNTGSFIVCIPSELRHVNSQVFQPNAAEIQTRTVFLFPILHPAHQSQQGTH